MTLFLKMEAGGLLSVRAHKVHSETLSTPPLKKKKNKNREGEKRRQAGRLTSDPPSQGHKFQNTLG